MDWMKGLAPGTRYGSLSVVCLAPDRYGKNRAWICRCVICGRDREVRQDKLPNVPDKCHCAKAGKRRQYESHGFTGSPEYRSWVSMKARCGGAGPGGKKYYRGRGIEVCSEWMNSFEAFLRDMGARPEGTTLDRINNDRGYYPGNCRWATPREQTQNSRRAKLTEKDIPVIFRLSKDGVSQRQIAARYGVSQQLVTAVLQRRAWANIPVEI